MERLIVLPVLFHCGGAGERKEEKARDGKVDFAWFTVNLLSGVEH